MGMRNFETKRVSPRPCDCCGEVEVEGQWWHLNNYFGISGYFCPNCHDKVKHGYDSKPVHPEQYRAVLVQQQIEKCC